MNKMDCQNDRILFFYVGTCLIAIKQDITSEQMEKAEQAIKLFLSEKKIPYGASISVVGAALSGQGPA